MLIPSIPHNITVKEKVASGNILFRLQALVIRISAQLSRLSQETQSRSQTMKKEYREATDKAAHLTKMIGDYAPRISGVGLGTSLAAHAYCGGAVTSIFEKFVSSIPETVPSIGKFITSNFEAELGKANSMSTLRHTELSNEAQKSGEARDLQSELQQLLGNLRDLFKKASS